VQVARVLPRFGLGEPLVLVVLSLPTPLVAQTAGRIQGTVADGMGAPVPGVAVVATSPSLQGIRSSTTDAGGEFRLLSVPPGTYAVDVRRSGFKTVRQTGVVVGLDRTMSLAFELEVETVSETLTVIGEAPVIDATTTTTGVNATADLFTRLPVHRDIYSIARIAAGTQEDGAGTVFYGSSGGLPTEYGRMTGGVVNVLTKSGGNSFKGDVFGFYEGGSLQSDDETSAERPQTTTTVNDVDHRWDFGGDLGGYLIKDELWFFGAYNRTDRGDDFTVIRQLMPPRSPGVGTTSQERQILRRPEDACRRTRSGPSNVSTHLMVEADLEGQRR
jgi:hypothetical protein